LEPSIVPKQSCPRGETADMIRARITGTVKDSLSLLEFADYESMVVEQFQEDVLMQLISLDGMPLDMLEAYFNDKMRQMQLVTYLKSMAGYGLWRKKAELEPFCKVRGGSKLSLSDYRVKHIDALKAEAGPIEVTSLVLAFSVPTKVYVWDELVGKPVGAGDGGYLCPPGWSGEPYVNLLLKQGRYIILEK